ncbi:hypothetical protein ACFSTD_12145 [Novosphingobium colocasiae]
MTTAQATAVAVAPVAQWPGNLVVGDDELPCYVLEDGRSVITRTGGLNFLTGGKGGGNLESYLRVQVLQPFLPADLDGQFFDITIPPSREQECAGHVGISIH